MRKKKKYLPLYYKWMEAGKLPEPGLCNCFDSLGFGQYTGVDGLYDFSEHPLFRLFKDGMPHKFWASDKGDYDEYTFGPTRQNIVLLMAAMNDEL